MTKSRHLIIGLGGTGACALAALRRETVLRAPEWRSYREQDGQTEYLYLDSCDDQLRDRAKWTQCGVDVSLPPRDVISLPVPYDLQTLVSTPYVRSWVGDLEGMLRSLPGVKDWRSIRGAGQLRRFGRALFAYHLPAVETALSQRIRQLTEKDAPLKVHIFCSLGGGTGSGALIDTITLLNRLVPQISRGAYHIDVHAFVAGPALAVRNTGCFFENQYATLRDLNGLMCGIYHPQQLSAEGSSFEAQAASPVTRVYLSSEYATCMSLEDQASMAARACFNLMLAGAHAEPKQVRELTESLLEQNHAGEGGRQSYRFASLSSSLWGMPVQRFHQLLEYDHQHLACEAWLEGTDADAREEYAQGASEELRAFFGRMWEEDALRIEWEDAAALIRHDAEREYAERGYERDTLRRCRCKAEARQESFLQRLTGPEEQMRARLAELGKDFLFHQRQKLTRCAQRMGGVRAVCAYLGELLDQLENEQAQRAQTEGAVQPSAELRDTLERREGEWEKLGCLARWILRRDRDMLREYCCDLAYIFGAVVAERRRRLEMDCLRELITQAENMLCSARELEKQLEVAGLRAEEAAAMHSRAEGRDDPHEVWELPASFEDLRAEMLKLDMAPFMQNYQSEWVSRCSPFERSVDNAVEALLMELRARFAHDVVQRASQVAQKHRMPGLPPNFLEELRQMAGPKLSYWAQHLEPRLEAWCRVFPRAAALDRSGHYLTEPLAALRSTLLVTMPQEARHAELTTWLSKQVKERLRDNSQCEAVDCPLPAAECISLTRLDYWFPARFAAVVSRLQERYISSLSGEKAELRRFFANIDEESQQLPELVEQT